MKKNTSKRDFYLILVLFGIWRVSLFIIAAIGEKILSFTPRFPYADIYLIHSGFPAWIWSFANFDGVHYLGIVQKGYWAQYTQVFFPLYPLSIRFLHLLFSGIHPIALGLIISGTCFFFSLLILYKLLLQDYDRSRSYWVLIFILSFPFSFYFGSLYTEGLFFFLLVSSFYFARKQKWWIAGIFGGLASCTKLIGVLLLPVLLIEYCYHNKLIRIIRSPILYLVPLGLFIYMVYLQIVFGDALYFWHAQPVFGAARSGNSIILLPQVIYRYYKILATNSIYTQAFWIPLLELVSTLGAIITLLFAHRINVRVSYIIFAWCAILIPTLTGTLSSMPRYILVAIPMYIVLSKIKSSNIKIFLIFLSFILQVLLTVLFTRGHWVA